MTDHYEDVYLNKAVQYEQLISKEDYQHNIQKAISGIRNLAGLDVVDSGAGTGRLACMYAPIARSITALDVSQAMLDVATQRLKAIGLNNWHVELADHRKLPLSDASADVVLSGWSVVYTVVWPKGDSIWQSELKLALKEMQRILKPGGTLIILETMGTGTESPNPPADLLAYFDYLKQDGFSSTWFRTDYKFESYEEARRLSSFFFGDEIVSKIQVGQSVILPECTGIWWKTF